jgi:hypothetical protein
VVSLRAFDTANLDGKDTTHEPNAVTAQRLTKCFLPFSIVHSDQDRGGELALTVLAAIP